MSLQHREPLQDKDTNLQEGSAMVQEANRKAASPFQKQAQSKQRKQDVSVSSPPSESSPKAVQEAESESGSADEVPEEPQASLSVERDGDAAVYDSDSSDDDSDVDDRDIHTWLCTVPRTAGFDKRLLARAAAAANKGSRPKQPSDLKRSASHSLSLDSKDTDAEDGNDKEVVAPGVTGTAVGTSAAPKAAKVAKAKTMSSHEFMMQGILRNKMSQGLEAAGQGKPQKQGAKRKAAEEVVVSAPAPKKRAVPGNEEEEEDVQQQGDSVATAAASHSHQSASKGKASKVSRADKAAKGRRARPGARPPAPPGFVWGWNQCLYPEHVFYSKGDKRVADRDEEEDYESDADYEVETILDEILVPENKITGKSRKLRTFFLVKWKGYELDLGNGDFQDKISKGDWEQEESFEGTELLEEWDSNPKPVSVTYKEALQSQTLNTEVKRKSIISRQPCKKPIRAKMT